MYNIIVLCARFVGLVNIQSMAIVLLTFFTHKQKFIAVYIITCYCIQRARSYVLTIAIYKYKLLLSLLYSKENLDVGGGCI